MRTSSSRQYSLANDILIRRRKSVLLPAIDDGEPAGVRYVASMTKNLESLGYAMSAELIDGCSKLSIKSLSDLHEELFHFLGQNKGAHRQHKPMYPNFPEQVMNTDDAELYINAFIHYLTDGVVLPNTRKITRPPLLQNTKLQVLKPASIKQLEQLFTQIASSNTSLSVQDKEDLAWFVDHYGENIQQLLPENIPNRENKAYLVGAIITKNGLSAMNLAKCTTATDVLRIAVAMSNGDVSLAEPAKFGKFSRPARRCLLAMLDKQREPVEDMLRWRDRWIRLGEKLHPGEFQKRYPRANDAFAVVRNKKIKYQTFNGKIEADLLAANVEELTRTLSKRPGDFARRLDHLLRLDEEKQPIVLEAFRQVASKVSTAVLIQVRHHFKTRNTPATLRVFFPKGNLAKAKAIHYNLQPLSKETAADAEAICVTVLRDRFARLKPLGKCYLDSALQNYTIPFSQRSASKALRTISRGSRITLPIEDTLRFFVWWRNQPEHRVDIDLSAAAFRDDFGFVDAITYYRLKAFGGFHSGDIVDAPQGASEFIDISMEKCLYANIRYVVMVLKSYSGQPYCDLPECFAGWMARKEAGSGEIYEPRTVQDKFDVSANTRIAIPIIFDFWNHQAIWTDISLTKYFQWNNNVDTNLGGIQMGMRAMAEMSKPNMFDLFQLHIEARGEFVEHPELAETVFSVANETPYRLESIASEFMAD